MITRQQLDMMLTLQDNMNTKVNPQWATAGYPFLRAVVIEGGEAMEHHGWKWWKKQTADRAQTQIELVDIWHFYLSHFMIKEQDRAHAATEIFNQLSSTYFSVGLVFDGRHYVYNEMGVIEKMELLIGLAVSRRTSVPLFECLMEDLGMSWDELYKQYVGKNVLNLFRQANGYKEGTYIKIWNGREDNVVLEQIMQDATTPEDIYAQLEATYAQMSVLVVVVS